MVEVTALYIYIVMKCYEYIYTYIYSFIHLYLRTLFASFWAIIFRKIAKMYLEVPGKLFNFQLSKTIWKSAHAGAVRPKCWKFLMYNPQVPACRNMCNKRRISVERADKNDGKKATS